MICCRYVTVALVAALFPAIAAAQTGPSAFRPIPSVGAGLATAQGTGAGFNLLGSLEFGGRRAPLRLRLDGQITQWQRSAATQRLGAITTNLVTELRPHGVRPFILAGAGGYAASGTGLQPGWNAGAGVVLPAHGRELILESRYHQWQRPDVSSATTAARYFVPLSLRLRF